MRTITSEAQRFPNPKSFLPVLVVKNWVEKRIVELESEPETAASKATLEKLRGIDIQSALIEPPILIDADKVKVCILSRKVGTLWLDEPVMKITFDEFLALAFPETVPNSVLYRAEPYTLEELEAIIDSERSAPVPGYIDVIDETGKTIKVIIGDVLDENTVHREALFGEFKFEKATTNVYGYDGDAYPAYPFATLNDFSLAITTIEDVFLKEDVVIHSVPLNLLRALKQENNKPPKITSVALAGASTVTEQTSPADYDITNELNVTFDKAPKPSDLVVVSLKDGNGDTLPSDAYSTRVLATSDPKVMNLEINLLNYQRRFFAPDVDGKKFSFSVVVKAAGVAKETTQELPVVWQNVGNTHLPKFYPFVNTANVLAGFPLKLSLTSRVGSVQVEDLTPLSFKDVDSLLKVVNGNASLVDTQFALTTVDGKPTIAFNLKAKNFGLIDLAFKDSRIVSQYGLIADPEGTYSSKVLSSTFYPQTKRLSISHIVNSPYDENMGDLNLVSHYKDLLVSLNGGESIEPEVGYVADGGYAYISLSVPFDSEENPINLGIKVTGKAYFGLNEIEVPFESDYIHNQMDEKITVTNTGVSTAAKNSDGKYQIGEGIVATSSLVSTTADKLELVSLHDANGEDITSKATLVMTKGEDGNFTGHILLDTAYAMPLGFKDADGKEGVFAATIGVKDVEGSESSVSFPYVVTRTNASIRAWVTAITTDVQTTAAKDSAIMEVAFLDENNRQITAGVDNDFAADYGLFSGTALSYLGGGIKFGKNADGRTVAKIKTKFSAYGNFNLTFADPAFKGDPSSIADPSSAYALNPISAVIDTQYKTLTLSAKLQKDSADYSIRNADWGAGFPKATIDGVADKSPGSSGWNNTVTPAISTVSYFVDTKTVVPYELNNSTLYLGANRVPVAFNTSGTAYTANGGPAETTPGMVDGSGNPIVNGGTTTSNQPVLSGNDMKPGSKVTITDNGGTPVEVTVGDDGKWTYTPDPALANGEHVFNIKGTDKNEMAVDKTITINVNASSGGGETDPVDTKPGMTDKDGNPIEDGATTTDNKPTFSGSDMKPGSTVTIKDGDNTLGTVTVDEDGTWTYQPDPALGNGSHEIGIVGTDKNDAPVDEKTTVVVDAPEEGGGTDPGQTDEEKALADPSEGGKYSAPGQAGFGSTMETYPDVTEVKPPYNLTATPIVMVLPYVDKGSID